MKKENQNIKQNFPLLKKQKDLHYLDNGATTQKPKVMMNALIEFYETSNANAHRGLYKLSSSATFKLSWARTQVTKFINANNENEIVFTKSATEALNLLAYSLESSIKKSDNIIVTELEHHSNYIPWQQLAKRTKAKFKVAKYDKEKYELENIPKLVDKNTAIVALIGMSNVTGQILDIEKIAYEIKQKNPNTLVIIDATQLIAHKKIIARNTEADFLVFSAHKIYGPMGVGVLWGEYEKLSKLRPFLYGGNMIEKVTEKETTWEFPPNKFEAGTIDSAGIYAFGKTLEWLEKQDLSKFWKHEEELKKYALKKLKEEGIKIYGHDSIQTADDRAQKSYGSVISFEVKGIHPHDLATIADKNNVCIRAGQHCCQPLMDRLDIPGTSRISISFYNDKKDIDALIEAIKYAKKILKKK